MKTGLKLTAIGLLASASFAATAASAATTFVGSWDVYNAAAPVWSGSPPNGPLAYTGQEAAALLFGGVASDYVISTVDSLVANIDNKAWYDTIGFGGGIQRAENYNMKYLGLYYGPTNGFGNDINTNAASAFIRDNLNGLGRINYAFRVDVANAVPESATWTMMIVGFGAAGGAMRYRRRKTAVSFG